MNSLYDVNYRCLTEYNAYKTEIEFILKNNIINSQKIIEQLKENFIDEINYITNNFGTITDKNVLLKIKKLKEY